MNLRRCLTVSAIPLATILSLSLIGCSTTSPIPPDFKQFEGRPGEGWSPVYHLRDCIVWKENSLDAIAITYNSRLGVLSDTSGFVEVFQNGKCLLRSNSGPLKNTELIVYDGNGKRSLLMLKADDVNNPRRRLYLHGSRTNKTYGLPQIVN